MALPTYAASHSIVDIQARLYYHETGTFDDASIIETVVHNATIGEGVAKSPSATTLVLVKIEGKWAHINSALRLRVTVGWDGNDPPLVKQVVRLDKFFTEKNHIWVPVVAVGTGCGLTRIKAELIDKGGTAQSTMTKSIPFECGE